MSIYILPVLFISTFIYAKYKKVNCYQSFVKGAGQSFSVVKDVFPYLASVIIMVELMRISGLTLLFANAVAPAFNLIGIPKELCELVMLKPFTGSGSLALLNNIYVTYGVDSYIGKCASVMIACSDTVFYISAVYFSQTKVKKLLYALPCALIACLVGMIFGCLLCRLNF